MRLSIDNERKLWPIRLWISYPSNLFPGPTTEDGHNLFLYCCFVDEIINNMVKSPLRQSGKNNLRAISQFRPNQSFVQVQV